VTRTPLPAGFGALWCAVAVDAIGFGIVVPILPIYAQELRASPMTIGLLLASFSLAQLITAPRWGRLSDRVGRRPALIASVGGTAIGAALTAVAPTVAILFFGRIVDGASGGSLAVAQAAAGDVAEGPERTRLLGLLGAAFGIGFVAGPAIGGLAALVGPRVPFLVAAALAAVNTIVVARRLPETRRQSSGPVLWRRGRRAWRWTGPGRLLTVAFLSTAAFGAFETTFALLATRRLGLTIAGASAVFVACGALVAVANARLVSPATRRLGDSGAVALGLALDAMGLGLLGFASSVPSLALAVAALALGHGLVLPALAAATSARVRPHVRGEALGSQQSAASLARVVGPAVAGAAFGVAGPTIAFLGAGAVAAAAAAIAAFEPRVSPPTVDILPAEILKLKTMRNRREVVS
jgi:MFS family permease